MCNFDLCSIGISWCGDMRVEISRGSQDWGPEAGSEQVQDKQSKEKMEEDKENEKKSISEGQVGTDN